MKKILFFIVTIFGLCSSSLYANCDYYPDDTASNGSRCGGVSNARPDSIDAKQKGKGRIYSKDNDLYDRPSFRGRARSASSKSRNGRKSSRYSRGNTRLRSNYKGKSVDQYGEGSK